MTIKWVTFASKICCRIVHYTSFLVKFQQLTASLATISPACLDQKYNFLDTVNLGVSTYKVSKENGASVGHCIPSFPCSISAKRLWIAVGNHG